MEDCTQISDSSAFNKFDDTLHIFFYSVSVKLNRLGKILKDFNVSCKAAYYSENEQKAADQTARMHRLISNFAVRI